MDGQEAFMEYKSRNEGFFDFMMMDIQMSMLNGFTAAKLIRKWEEGNNRRSVDLSFI